MDYTALGHLNYKSLHLGYTLKMQFKTRRTYAGFCYDKPLRLVRPILFIFAVCDVTYLQQQRHRQRRQQQVLRLLPQQFPIAAPAIKGNIQHILSNSFYGFVGQHQYIPKLPIWFHKLCFLGVRFYLCYVELAYPHLLYPHCRQMTHPLSCSN